MKLGAGRDQTNRNFLLGALFPCGVVVGALVVGVLVAVMQPSTVVPQSSPTADHEVTGGLIFEGVGDPTGDITVILPDEWKSGAAISVTGPTGEKRFILTEQP